MAGWLRALFGEKPKPKAAKPRQKTVLPPSERAALLKEALAAHRAGRSHVRDALERQLDEYRAKIPRPGRDPEATERMLSLQQADGALKRLMGHDLKRFLVLVGIRELLDEQAAAPKSTRALTKR
ncbi:MAG: hypothetical protein LCH56_04065 [Proteobacteria bacterium]|nr:hypothetical protein [Pseudomonadota bacterium]